MVYRLIKEYSNPYSPKPCGSKLVDLDFKLRFAFTA